MVRRADAGVQRQAAHLRAPPDCAISSVDRESSEISPPPPTSYIRSDNIVPDGNLIIHGDNLHALKALLPRYAGKVNCIYIDPPYNTGNEGWTYNDNVNSPMMQEWLKDNSPVDGEDLERHDKWLCMMWPRLQLLKELLADDGVIFISIDDNEVHHLAGIMTHIFGSSTHIATICWERRRSRSNDSSGFTIAHDYIIVYGRYESIIGEEYSQLDLDSYRHVDESGRRYMRMNLRMTGGANSRAERPNLYYGLVAPDGETVYPKLPSGEDGAWRWSKQRVLDSPNDIEWRKQRTGWVPYTKTYAQEKKRMPSKTIWPGKEVGTNTDATRAYRTIFPTKDPFPTCKPVPLLERILAIASSRDSIILDSFAGSGTTAHATLALNREDGGNRRFILVECEDYADTITAERVRRVIDGVPNAKDQALKDGLGGSFTYCTLGDPFDAESLLSGKSLPTYETLAVFLLHTAAGIAIEPDAMRTARNDQRFYQTETTDYYLYYEPDIEWLKSDDAMLTPERAKQIEAVGNPATVFGAGKYLSQRELTDMNITFCQLPYELFKGA